MKVYEMLPSTLYQRGHFNKLPKEEKLRELRALQIDVVVNLYKDPDPDINILEGFEYIFHPISDSAVRPPPRASMRMLIDRLEDRIKNGHRILVHCHAGRNRASLVTALVIKRFGMTGEQAVELVKVNRPNAFGNEFFAELVREGWL